MFVTGRPVKGTIPYLVKGHVLHDVDGVLVESPAHEPKVRKDKRLVHVETQGNDVLCVLKKITSDHQTFSLLNFGVPLIVVKEITPKMCICLAKFALGQTAQGQCSQCLHMKIFYGACFSMFYEIKYCFYVMTDMTFIFWFKEALKPVECIFL